MGSGTQPAKLIPGNQSGVTSPFPPRNIGQVAVTAHPVHVVGKPPVEVVEGPGPLAHAVANNTADVKTVSKALADLGDKYVALFNGVADITARLNVVEKSLDDVIAHLNGQTAGDPSKPQPQN